MAFKVTVDGKEYEVEQDAIVAPDGVQIFSSAQLAEGFVTKAAHDGGMKQVRTSMATEVSKAKEGRFTADELLADETQLQLLVDQGREKLGGLLKVEVTDADRARMKDQLEKSWTTQVLGPVEERAVAAEDRAVKLLKKALRGDVATAASEAGVRAGLVDFVVDRYEKMAAYDDESGTFFLLDTDGKSFKPNTASGDGQPAFLPILVDLQNRRASGEWGDVFDPKARDGAGVKDGANKRGTGPDGLDHIKKRSDAKNTGEKTAFISKRGLDAWEALPS